MAQREPLVFINGQIITMPAADKLARVEPLLGNPAVDGYVLSSTILGVRSWVAQSGGGGGLTNLDGGTASSIYPAATGIDGGGA